MKNTKERSKTASVILKIVRILLISIAIIALTVFGLYKLVTYQWKDTPQEYAATNQYITGLGDTMIAAHRGGRSLFPQGTMMAFEGCVNSQTFETDIIEFDVQLTADEKLIILHDETLDEVTNAVEHFGKTDNYPND